MNELSPLFQRETRLNGLSEGKRNALLEASKHAEDPEAWLDERFSSFYLSKLTGVSVDKIRSNYKAYSKAANFSGDATQDYNDIAGWYKQNSGKAVRPEFRRQLQEAEAKKPAKSFQMLRSLAQGVGGDFIVGSIGGILKAGAEGGDILRKYTGMEPAPEDEKIHKWAEIFEESMEGMGEAYGVSPENEGKIRHMIMRGFGQLAGMVVTKKVPTIKGRSIVPTALPIAGMSYGEIGRDIKEFEESGKLSQEEAFAAKVAYTAGAGFLEAYGFNKVIDSVFGDAKKLTFKEAIKRIGQASLAEGATEASQGALLDAIAKVSYDEGRELLSADAFKQRLTEFIVGAVVGGGAASLGTTVQGADQAIEKRRFLFSRLGGPLSNQEFDIFKRTWSEDKIRARISDPVSADLFIRGMNGDQGARDQYNAQMLVNSDEFISEYTEQESGITFGEYKGMKVLVDPEKRAIALDPKNETHAGLLKRIEDAKAVGEDRADAKRAYPTSEEANKVLATYQTDTVLLPDGGGESPTKAATIEQEGDAYAVIGSEGEQIGTFETAEEAKAAALSHIEEQSRPIAADTQRLIDFYEGMGKEFDVSGRPETALDAFKRGEVTEEQAYNYIRRIGGDPEADIESYLENVSILGKNEAGFRRRVWYDVSRIYAGASPFTVIEEVSEGYMKGMLDLKEEVTLDQLIDWKRQYEAYTGETTHGDTRSELIEWFSDRAIDYATGQSLQSEVNAPAGFMGFLMKVRAYIQHIITRADTIMRMKSDGELDPVLEKHLSAATLFDADVVSRKIAEMEHEQGRKDAGHTPEVELLNVIRLVGGLPSPNSKGARNDPLRAELRDLYDSWPMKGKNGRLRIFRNVNHGLDGIAEALRGEGFRVEGPNDLLDMIAESLNGNYTYPQVEGEYTFQMAQTGSVPDGKDLPNNIRARNLYIDGFKLGMNLPPNAGNPAAYYQPIESGTPTEHKLAGRIWALEKGHGGGAAYIDGQFIVSQVAALRSPANQMSLRYAAALANLSKSIKEPEHYFDPWFNLLDRSSFDDLGGDVENKVRESHQDTITEGKNRIIMLLANNAARGFVSTHEDIHQEANPQRYDPESGGEVGDAIAIAAIIDAAKELAKEQSNFESIFSETREMIRIGQKHEYIQKRREEEGIQDSGIFAEALGLDPLTPEQIEKIKEIEEDAEREFPPESGDPRISFQFSERPSDSEASGIAPEDLYESDQSEMEPIDEAFLRVRKETLEGILGKSATSIKAMEEEDIKRSIAIAKGAHTSVAGSFIAPIASRLRRINPKLASALRRFEQILALAKQSDRGDVLEYLKGFKAMSAEDRTDLSVALFNGDAGTVTRINNKYGTSEKYAPVRKVLDKISKRAKSAGMEMEYRFNYFPRNVKDYDKLREYLMGTDAAHLGKIDQAIEAAEREAIKKGKKSLPMEDRIKIINNMMLGYRFKGQRPSHTKGREIEEVTADMLEFYDNPIDALIGYIDKMNEAIERRRFFGKYAVMEDAEGIDEDGLQIKGKRLNLEESIGAMVADMIAKGEITSYQQEEVMAIFMGRFGFQASPRWIGNARTLTYLTTMGQISSAITQFGDFAFAAYEGGVFNTMVTAAKVVSGRKKYSREDIGIELLAQELTEVTRLNKLLDDVFTVTGLKLIDRIGKETLINSAMSRLESEARSGKLSAKNKQRLSDIFGDEADQVVSDLAEGKKTENTLLLAYNVILDYQPVALSEMPLEYLTSPRGRIAYTLKTFTVKQLDAFRREGIDEIARGNVKRGIMQLMKIMVMFYAANVPIDWIKDFIFGRKTTLPDVMVDNIWKLAGISRYNLYYSREVLNRGWNPLMIPLHIAMPPVPYAELPLRDSFDAYDEISKGNDIDITNFHSWRMIPVYGKFHHEWWGAGAERSRKRELKKLKERF